MPHLVYIWLKSTVNEYMSFFKNSHTIECVAVMATHPNFCILKKPRAVAWASFVQNGQERADNCQARAA